MRFIHGLTQLLIFLILVGEVAAGLYVTLGGADAWKEVVRALEGLRWNVFAAAAGLACLLLIHLLSYTPRREPDSKFVTFRSRAGDVSISVRAIRDFLQRLVAEFASVSETHITIRPGRNSLAVTVDLRVSAAEYVPEVCQMLQERIREALHEQLGIQRVGDIVVRVKEIQGPLPARSEESEEIGV